MADSDSTIAWHRAQLKKHREILREIEVRRFRFGETAGPKARADTRRMVADLQRKIIASQRAIGAYEKRGRDRDGLSQPRQRSLEQLGQRTLQRDDGARLTGRDTAL